MLYLINCEVQRSYYMDETKTDEKNHIVEANNEEEAIEKLQDFYSKKDVAFYVSFWVNINYCNEIIT